VSSGRDINDMKILNERKKQIIIVLAVFFANLLIDRFTKYLAEAYLKGNEAISFLNNMFVLVYAENTGAFLSMGKNWPGFIKYFVLLIVPLIICVAGLVYLMLKETRKYRIVLGACFFGGGVGNLIDRLFNNFAVVDFLNFGIGNIRTGILNAADLSVTFPAVILVVFEIIYGKKDN
jgi:signal peptidase II